jgi:hypothetical protein
MLPALRADDITAPVCLMTPGTCGGEVLGLIIFLLAAVAPGVVVMDEGGLPSAELAGFVFLEEVVRERPPAWIFPP